MSETPATITRDDVPICRCTTARNETEPGHVRGQLEVILGAVASG